MRMIFPPALPNSLTVLLCGIPAESQRWLRKTTIARLQTQPTVRPADCRFLPVSSTEDVSIKRQACDEAQVELPKLTPSSRHHNQLRIFESAAEAQHQHLLRLACVTIQTAVLDLPLPDVGEFQLLGTVLSEADSRIRDGQEDSEDEA